MHDWTLTTILYDWETAKATLSFRGPRRRSAAIVAENVSDLEIPHTNEWGPSVSVNEVRGPTRIGDRRRLEIEMQSGDVIAITAGSFTLPDRASNGRVLEKAEAK
jgi:hypothetical protein